MTEKSGQKFKYLENEKSFWGEIKGIYHHFKGLSFGEDGLRPESVPLSKVLMQDFHYNYIKKRCW